MADDEPKKQTAALKTVVGMAPIAAAGAARPGEKAPFVTVIEGEQAGMMLRVPGGAGLVVGRDRTADLTLDDVRCSRRHARIIRRHDGAVLIEDLGATNKTVVNGDPLDAPRVLADGDRILIGTGTILKFSLQDEMEEKLQSELYRSATRDPLTGVYNKRYFLDTLERMVRMRAVAGPAADAQPGAPDASLSLALFDLDHFKSINDTLGHLAGDEVLKAVARTVSGAIRAHDLLCRYGGEEFALILDATPLAEAAAIGERVRAAVAGARLSWRGRPLEVTVSVGVAPYGPGTEASEPLITAADQELYRAKRAGRNRVSVLGAR